MSMKRKDLLGLDGVSREEITSILDTAPLVAASAFTPMPTTAAPAQNMRNWPNTVCSNTTCNGKVAAKVAPTKWFCGK